MTRGYCSLICEQLGRRWAASSSPPRTEARPRTIVATIARDACPTPASIAAPICRFLRAEAPSGSMRASATIGVSRLRQLARRCRAANATRSALGSTIHTEHGIERPHGDTDDQRMLSRDADLRRRRGGPRDSFSPGPQAGDDDLDLPVDLLDELDAATSAMRTGSPMSSTRTRRRSPIAPAWMTSCTASSTVMKYRVTSGWVTVTGPPASICAANVVEHRAPAAEHVAEADAQEVAAARGARLAVSRSVMRLRPAEHADRVGGLVGGDVDEALDAVRAASVSTCWVPRRSS